MEKNLLYNPPLLRKKPRRATGLRLLARESLPFAIESMTGDGHGLLLTGRTGRLRYEGMELSEQTFHPDYNLSPTYYANRSAAISSDTGNVGFFYSDGNSYYRLRDQEKPEKPFSTPVHSLLQMCQEGLLLWEREGRLLYHEDFSGSFAPFEPLADEEITYFKSGEQGALFVRDGRMAYLGYISPQLEIFQMATAAKDKYLFAPVGSAGKLYLVEGRTLSFLDLAQETREKVALLDERPQSIFAVGETLILIYPDWHGEVRESGQKTEYFFLPPETISSAPWQEGLALRTDTELLLFAHKD